MKNRQNLGNFCFKNLKFQWRCPNPFIPVHTCEPGGHQSISHTSQQNQLPLEPINRLCKRLNGVVYRGSRSQKRSQRAVRGLGSRCIRWGASGRNWSICAPLPPTVWNFETSRGVAKDSKSLPVPGKGSQSALCSLPSLPAAPPLTQRQTQEKRHRRRIPQKQEDCGLTEPNFRPV